MFSLFILCRTLVCVIFLHILQCILFNNKFKSYNYQVCVEKEPVTVSTQEKEQTTIASDEEGNSESGIKLSVEILNLLIKEIL